MKKRFGRGVLLEIRNQAKERVAPICSRAEECGGCSWQQLDYPAQLQAKLAFVENAFQHIAHLKQVPVQPVVKSALFRQAAPLPHASSFTLEFHRPIRYEYGDPEFDFAKNSSPVKLLIVILSHPEQIVIICQTQPPQVVPPIKP